MTNVIGIYHHHMIKTYETRKTVVNVNMSHGGETVSEWPLKLQMPVQIHIPSNTLTHERKWTHDSDQQWCRSDNKSDDQERYRGKCQQWTLGNPRFNFDNLDASSTNSLQQMLA